MWGIKVLTGPQAGHIFQLKAGSNVLGRAPSCDIKILSPNISKQHMKVEVLDEKLIVSDLGSRNGTFVNGIQIKSARIHPRDQISVHELIMEIISIPSGQARFSSSAHQKIKGPFDSSLGYPHEGSAPSNFMASHSNPDLPTPPHEAPDHIPAFAKFIKDYLDRVVLPGVYHLATFIEFRWLLGLMMAAFILLVTSLSTIPLIRILRDSVEQQSQQHALTIAATLARVNEGPIREGLYTAINMQTAQRAGVTEALIIQAMDGKILAPASRAESYPDIPFVHEARKLGKENVRQVSSGSVVAVYPIVSFNPETGTRGVLAYSVVVYDMTSLAIEDSKTISLFITTLFMATILGGILFFFLFKLIEYPIDTLNIQLDAALREGRDDIKINYLFPALLKLTSNINSALTRILTGGTSHAPQNIEHDRRAEMTQLVEIMGFASMVIAAHDRTIAAVNQGFEERTRLNPSQVVNQSLESLTDQSLKLSLIDLIQRLDQNPDQLATNELEFSGQNVQLIALAIYGTAKIAYYVVALIPSAGSES